MVFNAFHAFAEVYDPSEHGGVGAREAWQNLTDAQQLRFQQVAARRREASPKRVQQPKTAAARKAAAKPAAARKTERPRNIQGQQQQNNCNRLRKAQCGETAGCNWVVRSGCKSKYGIATFRTLPRFAAEQPREVEEEEEDKEQEERERQFLRRFRESQQKADEARRNQNVRFELNRLLTSQLVDQKTQAQLKAEISALQNVTDARGLDIAAQALRQRIKDAIRRMNLALYGTKEGPSVYHQALRA